MTVNIDLSTRHQTEPVRPMSTTTARRRHPLGQQLVRFGVVGALNSVLAVIVLNVLVWALHMRTTPLLLAANAVAYGVGAVQSFLLNKRWTFQQRRQATRAEVGRFVTTALCGVAVNETLFWLAGRTLLPLLGVTPLATNLVAGIAAGGSLIVSFLGMRLWVFAQHSQQDQAARAKLASSLAQEQRLALSRKLAHYSISVVLPAYNEAAVISTTLGDVLSVLEEWGAEFEVIVVNDGSRDHTGALVEAIAQRDARIRLITHPLNWGYGAALAAGFAAATKDLTFFMDADGQFAVRDLAQLLVHIDDADAVLGYRLRRQDSWLRRSNAWAWNTLVDVTLGVHARDLDCAFKLYRTSFLHTYPPETQSALINAEMICKLTRSGATYQQVGVRHLPRQGGQATGANPRVIARALWDLLTHMRRWRSAGTVGATPT